MRKIHVLLLMGVEAVLLCAGVAIASRNSSGTMSAINGPYVAGTVISAATVNARFADIESEMTDSLNRSGKGPMLAPLRLTNGTNAAPSLTFDSDTDTGLYRIGADNIGVTIGGTKKLDLSSSALTITPNTTVSGLLGAGVAPSWALHVQGATAGATQARFGASGENPITLNSHSLSPNVAANATNDGSTGWKYATSNSTLALALEMGANGYIFYTAPAGTAGNAITFTERARLGTGGLTIGSGGTAIKQRMVGTTTWNPGTISACGAGPCLTVSTTISMSGVAASNPCYAGVYDPAPLSGWPVQCITTANTCSLMIVNQSNVNKAFGSATFYCVVEVL